MINFNCAKRYEAPVFLIIFFNFLAFPNLHSHGFGPNTFVKTDGYFCDIKQLCLHRKKQQQKVLSFNINSKTICSRIIKSAAQSETNCYIKLCFDEVMNDDILCTPTQEFYLPVQNQWIPAYQLKKGDKLLSDGWKLMPITHVQLIKAPLKVYSLEIEGTHTFFVGYHAILTHNMILPVMLSPTVYISLSAGAGTIIGFVGGPAIAVSCLAGGAIIGLVIKNIFKYRTAKYYLSYDIEKVEQFFVRNTQDNIQQYGATFEKRNESQGACGTSQKQQEAPVPGPCMPEKPLTDKQQGICPQQKTDQAPIPGPCIQKPADPEQKVCEVIDPTAQAMQKEAIEKNEQTNSPELNAQQNAQENQTIELWKIGSKREAFEKINDLPPEIQKAAKKSIKRSGHIYNEYILKKLPDGSYIITMQKPGDVPGSKAIYYKKFNSQGETIEAYKDTFDPSGNLVHRKEKYE